MKKRKESPFQKNQSMKKWKKEKERRARESHVEENSEAEYTSTEAYTVATFTAEWALLLVADTQHYEMLCPHVC